MHMFEGAITNKHHKSNQTLFATNVKKIEWVFLKACLEWSMFDCL